MVSRQIGGLPANKVSMPVRVKSDGQQIDWEDRGLDDEFGT
jgi:hypothetical protein